MTDFEKAKRVRDEICINAPEVYKAVLGEDAWAIASIHAESFYHAQEQLADKDPNADRIKELYSAGRSVKFIGMYLDIPTADVVNILQGADSTIVDYADCSIPWLYKRITSTELLLKLPEIPDVITSIPNEDELRVLRALASDNSLEYVANSANRTEDDVRKLLGAVDKIVDLKESSLRMYKNGRSPDYISLYLSIPVVTVLRFIEESGLPYMSGYSNCTIREFMGNVKLVNGIISPPLIESPADEREVWAVKVLQGLAPYIFSDMDVLATSIGRSSSDTLKIVRLGKRL